MLRLLVELGVQPEALLLPRRPGQGKCRMLQPISLEPLAAILAERCNKDLSRHKEVRRQFLLQSLVMLLLASLWIV